MKDLSQLIKQSTAGNASAQRELYMRFRSKWYMVSLRYGKNKHEADDILQEGLIQIYKDIDQFDPNRSGFETWSTRLISHAALKYLKKNAWHQTLTDLDEAKESADFSENSLDRLAAKELTDMLQQLPVGYRLIFNLHVLEGFNHREIAKKLKISEGTSKSQLFKARSMLRKKLEHHLTEYVDK